MKNTPVANSSLLYIASILYFCKSIQASINVSKESLPMLISRVESYLQMLKKIDGEKIREEFWSLAQEFDYPESLKSMYEVKFSDLLSMEFLSMLKPDGDETDIVRPILPLSDNLALLSNHYTLKELEIVALDYSQLMFGISYLRKDIQSLLSEYDAFIHSNQPNKLQSAHHSGYTVTKGKRTDLIKYLSAMFDSGLFVTQNDEQATSKQKLMEAFGGFLNIDLSSYSTSLSQAKTRDERTFMKPFKELEKEAIRYYNEGAE